MFGSHSHIGRRRQENQDSWGRFPNGSDAQNPSGAHLFVVADGMGGHARGYEASRTAVDVIGRMFMETGTEETVEERLRLAFEEANTQVFERANRDGIFEKMGTTCTALALADDKATVAHVGDSRAYLVRAGEIHQLTEDHTQVAELVRQGFLAREEANSHPRRSVLTRGMGVAPLLQVDISESFPMHSGDLYVLCSDGLLSVPPETIRDVVLSMEPQQACETLVEQANENGGEDNITVEVVRIGNSPEENSQPENRSKPIRQELHDIREKKAAPGRLYALGLLLLIVALGIAAYLLLRTV